MPFIQLSGNKSQSLAPLLPAMKDRQCADFSPFIMPAQNCQIKVKSIAIKNVSENEVWEKVVATCKPTGLRVIVKFLMAEYVLPRN